MCLFFFLASSCLWQCVCWHGSQKEDCQEEQSDVNEVTIIVEDRSSAKQTLWMGSWRTGGLSCISSELTDASYLTSWESLLKWRQEELPLELSHQHQKPNPLRSQSVASCSEYFNILSPQPKGWISMTCTAWAWPWSLHTPIPESSLSPVHHRKHSLLLFIFRSTPLSRCAVIFLIQEMSVRIACTLLAHWNTPWESEGSSRNLSGITSLNLQKQIILWNLPLSKLAELLIDDDLWLPSEIVAFQMYTMKWLGIWPKREWNALRSLEQ